MTQFKCMICGKVDELDKAVILTSGGKSYYICEDCDGKNLEIRGSAIRVIPSANTCVCCGEVIPEGRQVCWSCGEKAWDSARTRSYSESEGIMENPRTGEENRSFYVDDIDFSSINKLLSIHKIIDDAMEKRDRTVSIFISAAGTSVNVRPYEDEKAYWIYHEDTEKYHFECSNCGIDSEFQTVYCPSCGEQMHGLKRHVDMAAIMKKAYKAVKDYGMEEET